MKGESVTTSNKKTSYFSFSKYKDGELTLVSAALAV